MREAVEVLEAKRTKLKSDIEKAEVYMTLLKNKQDARLESLEDFDERIERANEIYDQLEAGLAEKKSLPRSFDISNEIIDLELRVDLGEDGRLRLNELRGIRSRIDSINLKQEELQNRLSKAKLGWKSF